MGTRAIAAARANGEARARARGLNIILLVSGAALIGWLSARIGVPAIASTLAGDGWLAAIAISAIHLIVTVLMGFAWWTLARAGAPWLFVWGRLVRDAGADILPFTKIGGYVLGVRAVSFARVVAMPTLIASTVIDSALEFCAQIAFTALGLVLLLQLFPGSLLAGPLAAMLGVAMVAATGFIVLQRRGFAAPRVLRERLVRRWLRSLTARAADVSQELRALHRSRGRLWLGALLHFLAWILSSLEIFVALRLLGVKVGVPLVLTLESLVFAARGAAFVVPGSIGVQEGAYVALGVALGLSPEIAFSLSLLKRARDLALGLPALASWHFAESRRQAS